MTFDEIIANCRKTLPSKEALRAGVQDADQLAPLVCDLVKRICSGECLQAADTNLAYYGLHILAAAGHKALWPHLVELARAPEEELDELLAQGIEVSLTRLMLNAWDGDASQLMHLIAHADLCAPSRTALFDTMTRLTFDGRIPRQETSAFLERYEREGFADADDAAWLDWIVAVTLLGLTELEPALRRVVVDKQILEDTPEGYVAERIADLEHAAAHPADASRLEERGIQPLRDPADAVAWLEDGLVALKAAAERDGLTLPPAEDADDGDPAAATRLNPAELDWLARFLVSRQAAPETMPLVMVDGYLTALAIGPSTAQPAEFLPLIWGGQGEQPDWRGDQQQAILGLLTRHWESMRERRRLQAPQRPLIGDTDDVDSSAYWAEGFLIGVERDTQAWDLLLRDRRGEEDLVQIEALCSADYDLPGHAATDRERSAIIQRLPRTLQLIASFWNDPAAGYRRGAPVRVQKVGRNDPCPCGSGKKHKRCCGLNPP